MHCHVMKLAATAKDLAMAVFPLLLILAANGMRIQAAEPEVTVDDLPVLELEELMQIEVTSVSKTPHPVSRTPAAVFVITQEDIRRSGARTIAEALRMAPGINVARIDANKWAVSSRGFNDFFANKLLVLQDGRSVYTPLFSGVFWDVQDTFMEDIERIEVIRGPGATVWGANAVNGVINIITKSSHDTHGGVVTAGGGVEERWFGGARYGGAMGENASYRAYIKAFDRDEFVDAAGARGSDDWRMFRGGMRTDWNVTSQDSLTIQGAAYDGEIGQRVAVFSPPAFFRITEGEADVSGGFLLGSWTRTLSENASFTVQSYYDRTEREDQVHHEIRDTFDLDFHNTFGVGERNRLTWGGGYRHTGDDLRAGKDPPASVGFTDGERGDELVSAFVQDEIQVVDDRFWLTLGSKFEHNDYTGFDVQPGVRALWQITDDQSAWAAVSRAVRTPARFEHTVDVWYVPPPAKLMGDDDFRSEEMLAYEVGYRVQPHAKVSMDFALFYNDYDDLRVIRPLGAPGGIALFSPDNAMDGKTYGGEVAVTWSVTGDWRLSAAYSYLNVRLQSDPGVFIADAEAAEGDSPEHQFNVRSYLSLPFNLEFDTAVYFTDELPNRGVDDYARVDARLGWRPTPNLEFSVTGQNLFDGEHPEFGPGFLIIPMEVERSVFGRVTWRF